MMENESVYGADIEKAGREYLRWQILAVLNSGRPVGADEGMVLAIVQSIPCPVTQREVRRELDYLADRGLVTIDGKGLRPLWHAKLTHTGIDVVEYTVQCLPGIARPNKWW